MSTTRLPGRHAQPKRPRVLRVPAITFAVAAVAALAPATASLGSTSTVSGISAPAGSSTIYEPTAVPSTVDVGATAARSNGVRFKASVAGYVTGIRFFKASANTGTHVGRLWKYSNRQLLAEATYTAETAYGWQQVLFKEPIPIRAGTTYVAGTSGGGHWSRASKGLAKPLTNSPLTAVGGSFAWGSGFPAHWTTDDLAIDLTFTPSSGASSAATKSTTTSPATSSSPPASTTATSTSSTAATSPTSPTTSSSASSTTTASTPDKASSAFPGPGNTGVPSGQTLKPFGDTNPTLSTPGAVYDGYRFDGVVTIKADNVTIRNSLIVGRVNAGSSDSTQRGLLIEDSTIDGSAFGSTDTTTPPAISFRNFTVRRVEIFGAGHGVQATVNVLVEDSWIHDLCCVNEAHKDAIISNGGNNITIRHNNIDSAVFDSSGNPVLSRSYVSAGIGLFGDFAPLSHITIENNLINTVGSYCMYGGDIAGKKYPVSTYIVVRNNAFGSKYHARCGIFGPVGNWTTNTGDVWSGNYYASTGAVIGR